MSLTCSRDSEKEEPPYDVALKLTARFTDRQFMRSARISGKWIGEEASTAYFPFIPDQPFRVKILSFCIPDIFSHQMIVVLQSLVDFVEHMCFYGDYGMLSFPRAPFSFDLIQTSSSLSWSHLQLTWILLGLYFYHFLAVSSQ